jgi:hypothetical protein
MITADFFNSTITCLSEVLPFGKRLSVEAAGILWITFPAAAKADLTPGMLQFAVTQRLLDPDPPKEVPIHIGLLRYCYRLENGTPNVAWGLKADLRERMARPDVFHLVATSAAMVDAAALPEARAARQLTGFLADWVA